MIRHPLTAIAVFPFLSLPLCFWLVRRNPGWAAGEVEPSTVGVIAALGAAYIAPIAWTIAALIRYRHSRARLEALVLASGLPVSL